MAMVGMGGVNVKKGKFHADVRCEFAVQIYAKVMILIPDPEIIFTGS